MSDAVTLSNFATSLLESVFSEAPDRWGVKFYRKHGGWSFQFGMCRHCEELDPSFRSLAESALEGLLVWLDVYKMRIGDLKAVRDPFSYEGFAEVVEVEMARRGWAIALARVGAESAEGEAIVNRFSDHYGVDIRTALTDGTDRKLAYRVLRRAMEVGWFLVPKVETDSTGRPRIQEDGRITLVRVGEQWHGQTVTKESICALAESMADPVLTLTSGLQVPASVQHDGDAIFLKVSGFDSEEAWNGLAPTPATTVKQ